jgi:NADPH-dependent glutamate synthase beta subunit-like oxidoreductase
MTRTYTRGGFAKPATSLEFKTGAWRVERPIHNHRAAPCHAACPAGEDPQAYLARIEEDDIEGAWREIVRVNPLPAVTGRVCPHFCETGCNRRYYDQAIAIHSVERFLGDTALREGWDFTTKAGGDGLPVAVVGSGPAGLTAAYHLCRMGHRPTLIEGASTPGGLLATAIPPYRLPRDTLGQEIEKILACGMDYRPNTVLGRDVSLSELQMQFSAVFLGVGAQVGRPWSVDGVTPRDLHDGLDLLKEYNSVGEIPIPRSVAVIGAGNTAIDVARILNQAGVPEVHVISHKAIPGPGVPPNDAMPALEREIHQALEEGVRIHEHRGVRRLLLRGEHVVGVELVHMKKLEQAGGRLARVAFEGTETVLHVDQVIPAVGQIVARGGLEKILEGRDYLSLDPFGRINGYKGLFAGGDASGRAGTVTAAVGEGRRAAEAIDAWLRHREPEAEPRPDPVPFERINASYFEHAPRAVEPTVPPAQRGHDVEVDLGLDAYAVAHEAGRCFSCGNCMACDNCWTLCPDLAVLKTQHQCTEGAHYVFDYDYCKGCGLCANECPCGYIDMISEL